MAVDYIPLASSPSQVDAEPKERSWARSPRSGTSGIIAVISKHFTKTRILACIPLLLLPIVYHIALLRLGNGSEGLVGENPYFKPGDLKKHHQDVLNNIARCGQIGLLRDTSNPTKDSIDEEEMLSEKCGRNGTTVIILASKWFSQAYKGHNLASEAVYAQSAISTLNAYGYSYVFPTAEDEEGEISGIMDIWSRLKNNVRMVWADPEQIDRCWKDEKCIKSESNPEGIEAWRLMSFWFGDGPQNPLGEAWTLSPTPLNNNTLLSYSIEPTCHRLPPKTPHDRASPPQAYLLAEETSNLQSPNFAWSIPYFRHLRQSLGIQIMTGLKVTDETLSLELEKASIAQVPMKDKMEKYKRLGDSFALIGSGQPGMPASPWEGLCMGVPFINPVLEWDEMDPDNKDKWTTQQPRLRKLLPPYVYHVKRHDLEGLKNAIKAAIATPIGSYIPPYMRFDAVCENTARVVEGDWRGRAQALLAERQKKGGATFTL